MTRRSYKQNCALALTGDLLCERWTLLIVRELLIQPCRYKELNSWLAGMGTNLLAQRLKELEAQSIIEKQFPKDKRSPYQLTEAGWSLEPVVLAMIRWGYHHLKGELGYKHCHHWDPLAMKALFISGVTDRNISIQFECNELTAWVEATPKTFRFELGKIRSATRKLPMTISEFHSKFQQGQFRSDDDIQQFVQCFQS